TTTRQDPANFQAFVPTAATLAGDFTAFASPGCNAGRQVNLRAPFVNNRVNAALFSKAAVTIASRLPKSDDPCGLFTYGRISNYNDTQSVGKIDDQRTAKDSTFGPLL